MATKKPLRAVSEDERREDPPSLMEAVDSGNVLDMLLAQRRLIAEGLLSAAENTRPQLNNELNKLHALIREEEARQLADQDAPARTSGGAVSGKFDASAV